MTRVLPGRPAATRAARLAGPTAALGAALALAPGLAAAGEDERSLGLSLGYVGATLPDHGPAGAGLALDLRRGVTDVLWLRAAVLGAALAADDGPGYLGQAIVGVTYALDVLRYVPYVDAGVGAALIGGGGLPREVHPEVEVGAGLDVLHSRSLSYGPFGRVAAYLDESVVLTAGVRIAYRWGFF